MIDFETFNCNLMGRAELFNSAVGIPSERLQFLGVSVTCLTLRH